MTESDRAPRNGTVPKRAPRSSAKLVAISTAFLVVSLVGIALTQPRLAARTKTVKQRDDVFVLPPPPQLRAMTLGYRAAVVDLLWAKLLVEYGTHWQEHRPFADLPRYLDAILAIEPDYAPLFRYVDTLLVYRPPRGTASDARLARAYLERGTQARPYDAKVWMQLGQFIAFIGPGFLDDDAERERWRVDGAHAMARAVDLGADADRAISAATILSKSGEREAAIRSLRNAYALTDVESEREAIAKKLAGLEATPNRDVQVVESLWRKELFFLSRGEYLLVGPSPDPLRCAGRSPARECAADWVHRVPSSTADPD